MPQPEIGDGTAENDKAIMEDIVKYLPAKQHFNAKVTLGYLFIKADVDVTEDVELVTNGTTLNGFNTVDSLKWATANNVPKGEEPDGLANSLSILHDLSLPSSFLPNSKRRRMLSTNSAVSKNRKVYFEQGAVVWIPF